MAERGRKSHADWFKLVNDEPILVSVEGSSISEEELALGVLQAGSDQGQIVDKPIALIVNKAMPETTLLYDPFDNNTFGWAGGTINLGAMELDTAAAQTLLDFTTSPPFTAAGYHNAYDRSNGFVIPAINGATNALASGDGIIFYSYGNTGDANQLFRFMLYNNGSGYDIRTWSGAAWVPVTSITSGNEIYSQVMDGFTVFAATNDSGNLNTYSPTYYRASVSDTPKGNVTVTVTGKQVTTNLVVTDTITLNSVTLSAIGPTQFAVIQEISVVSDNEEDGFFSTIIDALPSDTDPTNGQYIYPNTTKNMLKIYIYENPSGTAQAELYIVEDTSTGKGTQQKIADLPKEADGGTPDRIFVSGWNITGGLGVLQATTLFKISDYTFLYSNDELFSSPDLANAIISDGSVTVSQITNIMSDQGVSTQKFGFAGREDATIFRVLFSNSDAMEYKGLLSSLGLNTLYAEDRFTTRTELLNQVNTNRFAFGFIDASYVDSASSNYALGSYTQIQVLLVSDIAPLTSDSIVMSNENLNEQSNGTNVDYELSQGPLYSEDVYSGISLGNDGIYTLASVPGGQAVSGNTHLAIRVDDVFTGNGDITVWVNGYSAGSSTDDYFAGNNNPYNPAPVADGVFISRTQLIQGNVIILPEDRVAAGDVADSEKYYSDARIVVKNTNNPGDDNNGKQVSIISVNIFDVTIDGVNTDSFGHGSVNQITDVDTSIPQFTLTNPPPDNVNVVVGAYYLQIANTSYPLNNRSFVNTVRNTLRVNSDGELSVTQVSPSKFAAKVFGVDTADSSRAVPLPIDSTNNALQVVNVGEDSGAGGDVNVRDTSGNPITSKAIGGMRGLDVRVIASSTGVLRETQTDKTFDDIERAVNAGNSDTSQSFTITAGKTLYVQGGQVAGNTPARIYLRDSLPAGTILYAVYYDGSQTLNLPLAFPKELVTAVGVAKTIVVEIRNIGPLNGVISTYLEMYEELKA